jgi:HEAT repeats
MPDGHAKFRTNPGTRAVLLGLLVLGSRVLEARADRITLRGGGVVKGKLIPDKTNPGQLLLIGEVGRTPMVLKKDQVVQVVAEKSALDDYVVLRDKDRQTAEQEFALGTWCEEHSLKDLAMLHFESTVKRDSTFEAAHKKLGHVLMNGRWLNADEVKEAQGYIKYKGRWVTPEEKERRDMLAATAAEGNTWVKKLRLLRDAYASEVPDRTREAERRLLAIDETVAVGPILKVLGEDPLPPIRAMASRVLGGISGPEAANGLVGRLLVEEDEEVRQSTMNELARREASEIVPLLARSLRSKYHEVVNRSAWGLGNLNATITVPKLVPALITIEYEVVMVDSGAPSGGMSFNSGTPGGGGGGGIGTHGVSIPVLTGPVVGAGSVAYGATSVPYQTNGVGGTSFGVGQGGSRGPVPRLVPIEYRNDEVLAALVKMTGRNFGYDIPTWKQWVATSFKIESAPTRRVPQP